MDNIFSSFCNNKLYDYFILFHYVFLITVKTNLNCDSIHRDNDPQWDPLYRDVIKCTRTERKFKVDFLEKRALNEKFLFYIFDFFFHVESLPFRLYHQLPITLYIY